MLNYLKWIKWGLDTYVIDTFFIAQIIELSIRPVHDGTWPDLQKPCKEKAFFFFFFFQKIPRVGPDKNFEGLSNLGLR